MSFRVIPAVRTRVRTGLGVAVLSAFGVAACAGSGAHAPAPTVVAPHPTDARGVAVLLAGPPSRFVSGTVMSGPRVAPLTAGLLAGLTDLPVARDVGPAGDLSQYGLASALARISLRDASGGVTGLAVGGTNFDHHGVYVRVGDGPVELVLPGPLVPVLALVGVALPPPS